MIEENPFEKIIIKIDNMTCDMCIKHVEEALNARNGITTKKVKIGKVVAMVHKSINDKELKSIIQENGVYKVRKIKR